MLHNSSGVDSRGKWHFPSGKFREKSHEKRVSSRQGDVRPDPGAGRLYSGQYGCQQCTQERVITAQIGY